MTEAVAGAASPTERLLRIAPGVLGHLVAAAVIGSIVAAIVVAQAFLTSVVVASVFLGSGTFASNLPVLVGIVVLAIARSSMSMASDLLAQRASTRTKDRLRAELMTQIARLGPTWMSRERSGETTGLLTGGMAAVDAYLVSFWPARTLAVAVPLLVVVAVGLVDPPTTLVLLFTGPILVLLLAFIGGRAGAITDRRFDEVRWLNSFFLDMLQGLATLKMFGRSREQVDNIRTVSRRYGDTTMEVLRTAFQTSLVLEWGGAVAVALVAVEISLRLMAGQIEFERALAVLIIVPEFFLPLRTLAARYHSGAAVRPVAERAFEILDLPTASPAAVAPSESRMTSLPSVDSIRFAGVRFTYPGRVEPAILDLDLTLQSGRLVAVIGPSGAGKSTVANLLLRFIEPSKGAILVDDLRLDTIEPSVWRSRLAWVSQRPHLFHGTVADNIRLVRPDADDEQLRSAAREAGIDRFIDSLPAGYDTHVGEDGARLSGGQRQRIAIARAFLADARLVILDEATSHLDAESEAVIRDATVRLASDRIVLVVAHRLGLAAAADEVVVLEGGRIVGSGPPGAMLRGGT